MTYNTKDEIGKRVATLVIKLYRQGIDVDAALWWDVHSLNCTCMDHPPDQCLPCQLSEELRQLSIIALDQPHDAP